MNITTTTTTRPRPSTSPSSTRAHRRSLTVAAGLLAALAALTACDGATTHPPLDDVDPGWVCDTTDDTIRAVGTITNHSSQPSFYVVSVEFRAPDGEVAERSGSVDGVGPGETVTIGVTADDFVADGDVSCHVSDVTRLRA
jgi:hypothetical protein